MRMLLPLIKQLAAAGAGLASPVVPVKAKVSFGES
jgi:hypothetical protein